MIKRIVLDVDGVIAKPDNDDYSLRSCYPEAKEAINRLYAEGYEIVICTARYMMRYDGNQEKSRRFGFHELVNWLDEQGVAYHEVYMGKPSGHLYVDDRAFRLESDKGAAEWARLEQFLIEDRKTNQ
jgi:capsule biosynthesis phosphatase